MSYLLQDVVQYDVYTLTAARRRTNGTHRRVAMETSKRHVTFDQKEKRGQQM